VSQFRVEARQPVRRMPEVRARRRDGLCSASVPGAHGFDYRRAPARLAMVRFVDHAQLPCRRESVATRSCASWVASRPVYLARIPRSGVCRAPHAKPPATGWNARIARARCLGSSITEHRRVSRREQDPPTLTRRARLRPVLRAHSDRTRRCKSVSIFPSAPGSD